MTRYLFLLYGILLLNRSTPGILTVPIGPNDGSDTSSIVWKIENNLIPITKSGKDSGAGQPIIRRMAELGVRGVSIAVFDSGHIIWARGYGVKNNERSPVDTGTLFQAASISKPVTSAGVLRLYDENLLSLDEDVNVRLREWKVPENKYTSQEKVTIRRIISHMAGLSVHGFAGYFQNSPLPTLPQILDGTPPANSPPVRVDTVPGAMEIYSGGGFTILQLLIQDITGKPFSDVMHDLVLVPAGMTHSTFQQPLPAGLIPLSASGFKANGDMVKGGYHIYPEQAAAGLWTTPPDLARFMLSVGESRRSGKGILRQSTAEMMLTRIPNGSGLGFGLDGSGDAYRFRHNGQNIGFVCYAVSFANIGRGVVIMTNSDNGDELIHEIVRAVAREYHWPPLWIRE